MTANPLFPAIAVLAVMVIVLAGLLLTRGRRSSGASSALPAQWGLSPRPVFGTDERHLYRLLREALPQHVILAKLPLVRFCQPVDPKRVQYWFDLLGATHVAFAVCSTNGRVLAAIDLDTGRNDASRAMQLKQAALNALRVRYVRVPHDQMPSLPELQLLVPQQTGARTLRTAPGALSQARDQLSSTVASRRAARGALWQDSTQFPDSFFAPDTRMDGFGGSGQGGLYDRSGPNSRFDTPGYASLNDGEVAGVVVDAEPPALRR